mmetsp:Transcript_20534/g.53065  ORF Transcript_20534/g.53065 Transcript_20534/m.53065 type:complete len:390 (+) Transcript_20534:555-1724(+)
MTNKKHLPLSKAKKQRLTLVNEPPSSPPEGDIPGEETVNVLPYRLQSLEEAPAGAPSLEGELTDQGHPATNVAEVPARGTKRKAARQDGTPHPKTLGTGRARQAVVSVSKSESGGRRSGSSTTSAGSDPSQGPRLQRVPPGLSPIAPFQGGTVFHRPSNGGGTPLNNLAIQNAVQNLLGSNPITPWVGLNAYLPQHQTNLLDDAQIIHNGDGSVQTKFSVRPSKAIRCLEDFVIAFVRYIRREHCNDMGSVVSAALAHFERVAQCAKDHGQLTAIAYDDLARRRAAEGGLHGDSLYDFDLEAMTRAVLMNQSRRSNAGGAAPAQNMHTRTKPVCLKFNGASGCSFQHCKFLHKCSKCDKISGQRVRRCPHCTSSGGGQGSGTGGEKAHK